MRSILQLEHNRRILDNAIKVIEESLENPNVFIWIENSDGTSTRIQSGSKIKSAEVAYFGLEE